MEVTVQPPGSFRKLPRTISHVPKFLIYSSESQTMFHLVLLGKNLPSDVISDETMGDMSVELRTKL